MNHIRELTSRIRAFTRHNLSSFTVGTNNTHATINDEEAEQGERERTFSGRYDLGIPRIVYNTMEQALGSTLFPIVFYALIMLGLFFSAVILTAITGDGRRIPNGTIPTTNSAPIITNDPDPTSTSVTHTGSGNVIASFPVDGAVAVHPIEGNRFAAISIFLAMTVFSILTTLLAYRLLVRARLAAAGGSGDGTSQLRISNSMVCWIHHQILSSSNGHISIINTPSPLVSSSFSFPLLLFDHTCLVSFVNDGKIRS